MKIVVMKFGGTSVANLSKIRNVAKIVKENSQKNKLNKDLKKIFNLIQKSKKPILILGHGVKQSNKIIEIKKIINL